MKIRHARKVPPENWNRFAALSPSAWLHHLWEWQDLVSGSWPGYNLSFAIGEDGKMTGILPAFQMAGNPRLIDSIFGYGGFAYIGNEDFITALKTILFGIRNIFWNTLNESTDEKYFRVCLPPFPSQSEKDYQVYRKAGFEDCSTQSMLIDLSQSEDNIFKGFSSTTRNNIRNAVKSGITCRRVELGEASIKSYYALHEETYSRNEIPPHPFAYFKNLHTGMKDHYMCLEAVDPEGEILCMSNFGFYKKAAFYATAASKERSYKTNAAKLLQWEAMRILKKEGVESYNIGDIFPGITPDHGKLYGLHRFKSSFGGEKVPSRKAMIRLNTFLL